DIAAKKAQAEAQIAAAQANLDNASKDFDRYNALFTRQSATASELDNASLRYHAASSNLQAAQQMRKEVDASAAYARLTAPFTGTVTQRLMDEGSLATPGTPILVIEEDETLRVSASIAESDISRIRKGDTARIEIKSTGSASTGIVTGLATSSTGGQYQAKISLPASIQKGLYSGMYVNVYIPLRQQKTGEKRSASVLVPASALVEKDQLTGIYTIGNGQTALLRWIRTGRRYGNMVEVLSGLNANETYIREASGRLYDGAPVQQQQ
ncbi:MAG: efflux RND transporter periplasmic adaptor subunit, partial [Bacteroidetes bacterium]|nr:efflux RND transporter periplasmic adaptor subunit [Bacteroidota bacterium]